MVLVGLTLLQVSVMLNDPLELGVDWCGVLGVGKKSKLMFI